LGHNILYVTVGLVWIHLAEYGATGEATIRQDPEPYGYQLGAMLCFLIFLDNLLKQIKGPRDTVWFGFSSGRWGLVLVFGVLSVLCQLLFWSDVVHTAIAVTVDSSTPSSLDITTKFVLGMTLWRVS
jgi:hypothetical protein